MFGLGVGEILIILAAALIFIGPKKLPEIARGLGKGLKEFQNAARGITETINEPVQKTKAEIQAEIKKNIPSFEEQFKDDPPHDNPGEDFVSAADIANLPDEYSPEHDGEYRPENSEEKKENS